MATLHVTGALSLSPRPLERVSPSTAEILRECPLRLAFDRDDTFNDLSGPSLKAVLGTVAHKLLEDVARGKFDQTTDESTQQSLMERWETYIEKERDGLIQKSGTELVPPVKRWPGYQKTLARTRHRLMAVLKKRRQRIMSSKGRKKIFPEKLLSSPASPLLGKIDRMEISEDGDVEIVDIKTGWRPGDPIPDRTIRQLQFYGVLLHEVKGQWPITASIESLDGERTPVTIVEEEAKKTVNEAVKALEDFNSVVGEVGAVLNLARPSATSCKYCDYKAACKPFFDFSKNDWGHYEKSLLGEIHEVLGTGILRAVDIDCVRPAEQEGNKIRVMNVPENYIVGTIGTVGLAGLSPTKMDGQLEFNYSSKIWAWDTAAA